MNEVSVNGESDLAYFLYSMFFFVERTGCPKKAKTKKRHNDARGRQRAKFKMQGFRGNHVTTFVFPSTFV